jgi:uncharacterized membrane protein YgdD (TMEM256/DUF423 family)
MWTIWFGIGALFSAIAIGIGAFGAHALKGVLSADDAVIFETATKYLTHHSLGLIAVALLMSRIDSMALKFGAPLLMTGFVIFSGSLYVLIWTGHRWLGAITPIGGVLMIVAWLLTAWAAISAQWL